MRNSKSFWGDVEVQCIIAPLRGSWRNRSRHKQSLLLISKGPLTSPVYSHIHSNLNTSFFLETVKTGCLMERKCSQRFMLAPCLQWISLELPLLLKSKNIGRCIVGREWCKSNAFLTLSRQLTYMCVLTKMLVFGNVVSVFKIFIAAQCFVLHGFQRLVPQIPSKLLLQQMYTSLQYLDFATLNWVCVLLPLGHTYWFLLLNYIVNLYQNKVRNLSWRRSVMQDASRGGQWLASRWCRWIKIVWTPSSASF